VQSDLLDIERLAASTATRFSNPCNLPDVSHWCNILPPQ
jgi:hypothetical protein